MTEQNHIKVLLSPRTNTLLRVGLEAEYTRRLVEDYIKEEGAFDLSDDRFRSMSPAKRMEHKERIARSKAEDWLKTSVGKEAMERHIEEQMQQLNLDHAVRAFKKSNPWYMAIWLNLAASALGAFMGPTVLRWLANWALGQGG